MADVASLLTRFREGTEGSRELDTDLALALGWIPLINVTWTGGPYRDDLNADGWFKHGAAGYIAHPNWGDHAYGRIPTAQVPAFTTSLDAALALVERVHPKCGIDMATYPEQGRAEAYLRNPPTDQCFANTLPLAILAALLMSLEGDG